MRKYWIAAAFSAAFMVAAQAQTLATVHIYRTGRHTPIHVRLDGKEIFKIENNHVATLKVEPGYHQISSGFVGLGSGNAPTGVVAINAAPGGEYFVHIDFEAAVGRGLLTGGGANDMHLLMQQEPGMPPGMAEQIPKENQLELAASIRPEASLPAQAALPLAEISDAQVEAAILQGSHDENPDAIGLYLNDLQTRLLSGVGNDGADATSGFSIVVYSPTHWIEYNAAIAHRQLRPFSAQDVTPEMRADAFHIVALPNTPDYLNRRGVAASSGVERIVLCDKARTTTVQPLAEQEGTVSIDSALRSKDYRSLASAFNKAEVDRLRGMDRRHEFFIVVIGDSGSRKYFEVKEKFAAWL